MRHVVITGGASGLGRAMAERFIAEGNQVAICDADQSAVAAFATTHPSQIACAADVTDEAQMEAFFDQIDTTWDQIDVVCANAGIGGPAGRIEDLSLADWNRCVEVNLSGTFLTCRWAAGRMLSLIHI